MITWNKEYNMYKSISLGIDETTYTVGNTTVNTNIKTKPIEFGSWETLFKHIDNLSVHPMISYLMIVGRIVIDPFYRGILSMVEKEDTAFKQVCDVLHPWTSGYVINDDLIQTLSSWVSSGMHKTVHLRSYLENADVYNLPGFPIAVRKHIAWLFTTYNRESFPYFKTIGNIAGTVHSKRFEGVDCYLLFGKITPNLVNRVKEHLPHVVSVIRNINRFKQNPDWNYVLADDATYLSAGVRHRDLKCSPDIPSDIWSIVRGEILNTYVVTDPYEKILRHVTQIYDTPSEWCDYVFAAAARETMSLQQIEFTIRLCEFIQRNEKKLNKSRTVYGPAGATAEFHYHSIIEHITSDILSKYGMSFDRVFSGLQRTLEDKLREQLKDPSVSLNKIDTEFPEWITPLSSVGELIAEGETMSHCVLGYANKAIDGPISLVHVGEPAPLGATAEIILEDGRYKVLQCRGWKNDSQERQENQGAVTIRLEAELKSFIDSINSQKQIPKFVR